MTRSAEIASEGIMADKAKRKAGQPTKFNAKVQKQILCMALKSFTDAEMADILNVTEQTLNNWKITHSKFFESLKDAKKEADESVVKSLHERAMGYEHAEEKIFCNADGEVTTVQTVKHYPPDPTSMIFWLKNRNPEEWRDKQEREHTGKIEIEGLLATISGATRGLPNRNQKKIEG